MIKNFQISKNFELLQTPQSRDFSQLESFRHKLKNDEIDNNLVLKWRHQTTAKEWFDAIDSIYRLTRKDLKKQFVIEAIKENCVHLGELKGFLGRGGNF